MKRNGRYVKKTFLLSEQEDTAFRDKASQMRMSQSEYFRILITQKPMDYPEMRQDCKRLINEVNRIGKNINQIVYHHNANWYQQGDKEALIAYMKRLNQTTAETLLRIGNY